MKKKYISILLFFSMILGFCQTTLLPGDIAITSINADGNDEFSFIIFTDITSGTEIYFTENGWDDDADGGGANPTWGNTTEGTLLWTSTSALTCGTEIQISSPNASISASTGTISRNGSWAISGTGDSIIAYQGTGIPVNGSEVSSFLWAIHIGSTGFTSNASSTTTSGIPASLTSPVLYAVQSMSTDDNYQYNCSVISGVNEIRNALKDISNFISGFNSENFQAPGCAYNCSTLSVESQDLNDLTIFPNPFENYVYLKNLPKSISQIEVINQLGQTVFVLKNNFNKVSFENLEASIYFVKISTPNSQRILKIVKR